MSRRAATATTAVLTTSLLGLVGLAPGTAAAAPAPLTEDVTTASSDSGVRADGARVVTLYSGPVRMQRPAASGGTEWTPVDLTLRAGPDGVVRPVAGPQDLTLTPTGPSVRYASGGSAAVVWPTALPAPRLDGNRAVYPQVSPGWDLEVEATRVGFVASVRKDGTPAGPAPALVLKGNAEAVPDAAAARSMTEAESAVSRVVAAEKPAGAAPVPFDTTVQTTIRNTDTSGEPELRLGSYDGVAAARSFLTWDVAQLAGKPVGTATLEVFQSWSASCRARGWEVRSLNPGAAPVGPAVRWANQPAADAVRATSTDTRGNSASCAPGWTSVDVTPLVREWAAAGAGVGTMALRATDETDPLSWKRFDSSESPNVPRLTVTLP
ncbi:MAG: DNRLRE domain-containing protein [Pseudonocardia sp.]|nr:DNRLRE domain-containing protein [Pseudonocardia sp.]